MTFKLPKSTHDVDRYPLLWPPEKPRTMPRDRLARRWDHCTLQSARSDLDAECKLARIHDYAVSLGVEPGTRAVRDCGVVMWFMQPDGRGGWAMSCHASDRFREPAQNLKAVAMTIQRLRQVADYGVYTVEQAMRGAAYDALPPPKAPPRPWWEILSVTPTSPRFVVDAAFRALAQRMHPDKGGSADAMAALNEAYERAKAETT